MICCCGQIACGVCLLGNSIKLSEEKTIAAMLTDMRVADKTQMSRRRSVRLRCRFSSKFAAPERDQSWCHLGA
jgi:hypothetical protein